MPISSGLYLRTYYLPNNYLPLYLSIKKLRTPAIECFSLKPSLGMLSLFYHIIKSSNTLSISWAYGIEHKSLSGIIFAVWLISASLLKGMILLGR